MTQALVDVCWADVDKLGHDAERFVPLLSHGERERAGQFRFPRDRQRYVVRRGLLREILTSYTGGDPRDLAFVHNANGKPSLSDFSLHFNLSHSHGIALYAVSRDIEVGCDIERRDPKFARDQIPEQFFSNDEVRRLRGLPAKLQTEAFFNCWTRKEAFVKALGCGLSRPLDSFDVSLAPGEPAELRRGCEGWSVASIAPVENYAAAIVARGTGWHITNITECGGAATRIPAICH